jgi:transposase
VPSVAATRRHDLTDGQWAALEPVLPASSGKGRPPKWTKRQIIDGILAQVPSRCQRRNQSYRVCQGG